MNVDFQKIRNFLSICFGTRKRRVFDPFFFKFVYYKKAFFGAYFNKQKFIELKYVCHYIHTNSNVTIFFINIIL